MLWDCPKLRSFWGAVFHLISKTTGFIKSGNVEMAILSIHVDLYPSNLRSMVIQILMAARLIVTRKWKTVTSPNISEVIKKVDEAFNG